MKNFDGVLIAVVLVILWTTAGLPLLPLLGFAAITMAANFAARRWL